MDSQLLKTFIQLSSTRNFTQTAKLLFVAQSTVTNRINELEKAVGKPLFFRDKKKVALTPEGELFLGYAKRLLELEKTALQQILSIDSRHPAISVGATNSLYESHLFPVIRSLQANDPGTRIKVIINHSFDLLAFLQDGLIDVAFTSLPFNKNGYLCHPFREDELLLVTMNKNREFTDGIHQADLVSLDYLFCNFALQKVGQFIRELFPPHHPFAFEIDNSSKLLPYLLDGFGYSFLPKSLISAYLADGSLISIPLLDFETPTIRSYCIYQDKPAPALTQLLARLQP